MALVMVDDVFRSAEEDDALRKDDSSSPEVFVIDCGQLPFERMGDDHFELLLADIYTEKAKTGEEEWFDTARRLNGGADQGRDIILFKEKTVVGVIQCKRYKGNLGRGEIIKEICKFFMYAKIMPEIASEPDVDFRYYVAVSVGVTSDLFSFLTSKGRQRFEDLRSEFEEKALQVRNSYASLREHSCLAGLDKVQLCDIVWERIDHLHTDLHKRDDLSRTVAEYPQIKSRYFKLESDLPELYRLLKAALPSLGSDIFEEEKIHLAAVRTEYIDRRLESNDQINVGLIQGNDFLPTLRGLTDGTDGPLMKNFGSRPALIAAGSTAVKPGEWGELNDLIKGYPYPLVLSVGCGDVYGSTLLEWIESDEMTWIDSAWMYPATGRKYKAGWCWVTDPDEGVFSCYILVGSEPSDTDYDHANLTLRLAFKDLIVWPTLADDFIGQRGNTNSQLRRIIASQTEDKNRRRNVVLVSIDVTSLNDVLRSVSDYPSRSSGSPVLVALANSGRVRECGVGLHSATGIFPALDAEHNTRSSPPAIQPPCSVMRRTDNGALTLNINFRNDFILKLVKGHRLVDGNLRDDLSPTALEFHELFERYPPVCGYNECSKKELDGLDMLVQQEAFVEPKSFIYRAKHGVKQGEIFSFEDLIDSGKDIMKAMQALSYVKSHGCAKWVVEPNVDAHIQICDQVAGEVSVIAWADHSYPVRQMLGDLYEWANRNPGHPTTLVFASAFGHVKDAKPNHIRCDYTSPPPARRSFTEAASPQNVYMFNLGEIESLCDDDDAPSAEKYMENIDSRRRLLDV